MYVSGDIGFPVDAALKRKKKKKKKGGNMSQNPPLDSVEF